MSHAIDIAIIGTGPAGLTAAIYAARAGFAPTLYAGIQHGGQLTTTTEVENFPGFAEGIMGPQLMSDMTSQAERFGATIVYDTITKVDFSKQPLRLWTSDAEIQAKAVIIATGATAKTLGLANESMLMGRGLSTCATCDGFFYKGKKVAVIGGGDSAMEEAGYLAKLCREVYLIHRRDEFRASKIMVERMHKTPNIKLMTPYAPVEWLSNEQGVTGVRLQKIASKNSETIDISVDGAFMAIGHRPNSEIFAPYVDRDELGYILTREYTATRTPGVFAAGDISDHVFRQAITAAGMGCQAAIQATRYLESMHT